MKHRVTRRRWTADEDAAVHQAAYENTYHGIVGAHHVAYENRLRAVAKAINRTYAAVRIRASRIGACSYNTMTKLQRRIDDV